MSAATSRGLEFALARITLELRSPLTIGTGGGDDTRDALCVADANGLPALPASSLAGVLRHALAGGEDPERHSECRDLFGWQDGQDGQPSRVELSWAHVHGANDQPVPCRGADLSDPVLVFLSQGVLRDHVRINHRGVADAQGMGKFDRALVPAGARFTFELLVHGGVGKSAERDLKRLISLMAEPWLRLGGHTRGGLGAFDLRAVAARCFDLRKPEDRQAWLNLPRALDEGDPHRVLGPQRPEGTGKPIRATLTLRPQDHWIFGGGSPQRPEHLIEGSDRSYLHVPVTERRIEWRTEVGAERGKISEPVHFIPSSGVKGALRHRVAFHARRLTRSWVKIPPESGEAGDIEDTPEEVSLFGQVKGEESGRPGRVFLTDVYIGSSSYSPLNHVSLDRFTQGPMTGLLFNEAPLYMGPPLILHLDIAPGRPTEGDHETDLRARRALKAALTDLCHGRLALGAGGSKGHGFMEGDITWSDKGRWIEGEV